VIYRNDLSGLSAWLTECVFHEVAAQDAALVLAHAQMLRPHRLCERRVDTTMQTDGRALAVIQTCRVDTTMREHGSGAAILGLNHQNWCVVRTTHPIA